MKAMVLNKPKSPLVWTDMPDRHPEKGQVRVKVLACGVCRTDLHVCDGELPNPKSPIIPGHEIVGRIIELGEGVTDLKLGERVGIPWLGHTCGVCPYCIVPIANPIRKTSATRPYLPDTQETVDSQQRLSPMPTLLFHWAKTAAMYPWLPYCVPD